MNPLENINDTSKDLIKEIVEGYKESSTLIETGLSTPYFGPGLMFSQLFSDDECLLNVYIYQRKSKILTLEIEFPKYGEESISSGDKLKKYEKYASKKKSKFIENLLYLISLYDNGLIYFSGENQETSKKALPIYTSTLQQKQSWYDKFNVVAWNISYPTIYNFVCKFYYTNVIPTPTLIDYYENGYVTEDTKRYNEQLTINKKALEIAKKANRNTIIVSIIVCAISLLAGYILAISVPVSIHKSFTEQLNYRLDNIYRVDSIRTNMLQNISVALDSIESSANKRQIQQDIKRTNNEQVKNAKP